MQQRVLPRSPNDLWRLADDMDAVELHLTRESTTVPGGRERHYGVYLDVRRLLDDERFRGKCLSALRKVSTPDEVIVPRHTATDALLALLREGQGKDLADRAIFAEYGKVDPAHAARLARAERILILDDALVTGTTLVGIRRNIYGLTKPLGANPAVEAFVLISRPPSEDALQRARRNYGNAFQATGETPADPWGPLRGVPIISSLLPARPRPRLPATQVSLDYLFVFEMFLPLECPWCEERGLLRRLRPLLTDSRAAADARYEQLLRKTLRPQVMIAEANPEGRSPRSAFGEVLNRVGFAAAAHEAQKSHIEFEKRWRVDGEIVVANTRQLFESYYDTVFVGGLLRTFSSRELRYGQDPSIDEAIATCGVGLGHDNLVEIGWAAVAGRLPRSGVRKALADYPEESSAIGLIRELLDVIDGPQARIDADAA